MKRIFLLLLFACQVQAQPISVVLDEVPLVDLVKLAYGEVARQPYVLSHDAIEARQSVSVSLRNVEPRQVVDHVAQLLRHAGLQAVQRNGVVWIGRQDDIDDEIVVYKPRHRSARYLSDIVQPLTGARSLLSRQLPQQAVPVQGQAQPQQPGQLPAHQGSLTSVAGMTDRSEVDQIAFSIKPKDSVKLRKLLADLDTPAGEVLLKAAVYEVGTNRTAGSAISLALSIAGIEASAGDVLFGNASFKLKLGGIEAVLDALDRDSRFRSLSRPQVRVRNGSQARFSVGQDVPILGAQQLDRNGNPIQSIEYKPSGIILTARPEIRLDEIELDLNQELSSFITTTTGVNNSPTLTKRSVSTKLSLQPGEVVILAGLQDDKQDGQANRLPFFGWLLGDRDQQQQSEILVFIEASKIDPSSKGLTQQ